MNNYNLDTMILNETSIVLKISGDLNIANTKKLISIIKENINRYNKIIVDLSDTSYLNSTALGAFISFRQHKMKEIKFVIPSGSNVFSICAALGLKDFFSIYESLEQVANE